nr:MAG TPA: hypothetical protein [Caudoviricetes sp.]
MLMSSSIVFLLSLFSHNGFGIKVSESLLPNFHF